ncbi:MAG TPA: ATP-binding cassette domain-containing protein, partial [Candidatus Binatia bacterium]|nr:ATP-binding cassette domain-containing protein [Candidatus Binatia bacterium]
MTILHGNHPLLRVEGLSVDFASPQGAVRVVEALSFELHQGETLCIAGESGSGKSVTALSIMGLLPKPGGRVAAGRAMFE